MPNGTLGLRSFVRPLLFSVSVVFVPVLLALSAISGTLSVPGIAGALLICAAVALLLFAPIAFIA